MSPARKSAAKRAPAKKRAAKRAPKAAPKAPEAPTTNRAAVERHIAALREAGEFDTEREVAAQMALTLASGLDGADTAAMTSACARELRHAMEVLVPKGADDDDDGTDGWVGGPVLPAPVRHTP